MILLPVLIGAALAAATVLLLSRAGMVRSGIVALVVIAVAGFWPLFAVASQNDGQIVLHMTLFAAFAAAASLGVCPAGGKSGCRGSIMPDSRRS